MPIYDFKCLVCNSIKEAKEAPKCCGVTMAKQFSAPAIHFKGKGWGHQ